MDIKSSTVEKGLALAKEFAGKLVGPAIEELGLLIGDNVKYWRFKNQVKIFLKAKEFVENRNIKIKEIPIKILVPLLDKASLEEDEVVQERWAKMLTNMVDSEKNLQSQIFPFILSQISSEEFDGLRDFASMEHEHRELMKEFREMKELDKYALKGETRALKDKVDKVEQEGYHVLRLQEFELSNLIRLGLIRAMPPRIYIEGFSHERLIEHGAVEDLYAEYDWDFGHRITELGLRFLDICELSENGATT